MRRKINKKVLLIIILIVSCSSLLALGRKDEKQPIIDSLKEKGFDDLCSYPAAGNNISPCVFIDKYTFIERCGDYIVSRNILKSEEIQLVKIEDTPAYTNIYLVENDTLFYSVVRENDICLYSFSFATEETKLLYETSVSNSNRDGFTNIRYSFFDGSENKFYIIDSINQDSKTECIVCNISTGDKKSITLDNSWIPINSVNDSFQIVVESRDSSSEYALFNLKTGTVSESICFNPDTVALRSVTQNNDNCFYAVNREYRTVSDIYKIDFSQNTAEPILKDFEYGIKGIWSIPDGGFCFLVYGNNYSNNSYVFCYFD